MERKSPSERKRAQRERQRQQESLEERQQRLEEDRVRHEQERDQESAQKHQQRLEAVRERATRRREQESAQEHQQRLEAVRERRDEESAQEHQQRLDADRDRATQRRDVERLEQQQMFAVEGLDMSPETLEEKLGQGGEEFFKDFNCSLAKSLLLFYVNSGLFRFDQYKDYCAKFDGEDIDQEKVGREIMEELLTDEELEAMLRKFAEDHTYTNANLMSCGACGIREFERPAGPKLEYKTMMLDATNPSAAIFQYTDEEKIHFQSEMANSSVVIPIDEIDNQWCQKTVEVWKAKSVFVKEETDGSTSLWHLHPELVEPCGSFYCTKLCPHCADQANKNKRPKLSIAAGVDFGYYKRLGLTLPNLHEQLIIARTRLYFATIKVCSNITGSALNHDYRCSLRCHAILFPHDAPMVASQMLNKNVFSENGVLCLEQMKQLLMFYFIDDKGNLDQLAAQMFGTSSILARAWVTAQWLLVLQKSCPHYFDLNVSQIHESHMNSIFRELHKTIREESIVIDDPVAVAYEMQLGSDVAQNQHHESTQGDSSPDGNSQNGNNSIFHNDDSTEIDSQPLMRYSHISNTEHAYLALDKNDFRLRPLEKILQSQDSVILPPVGETGHKSNMLFTCKLLSGDVVAISRGKTGMHAFLDPLVNFLQQSTEHGEDARDKLKVDYVGWEVDENDPTKYKEDHPHNKTSLQNQKYAIFFMAVLEESASKNTPENRKRWAEGLCVTNNLPGLARQYSHGGGALNVGSDITPLDSSSLPPLSKFLTIADTMAVISMIYRDTTAGKNASVSDIMDWPECLGKYFTKDRSLC